MNKEQLEEKINNLNFDKKLDFYINEVPKFYVKLVKGNIQEKREIIITDGAIKMISYKGFDITKEQEITDLKLINKIKTIVIKNKKKFIKLSLKLNDEYVIKHGLENSYTDSILVKIENVIFSINNGSIGNKTAIKMFDLIYNELNI